MSETDRSRALARFRLIHPFLEDGVPLTASAAEHCERLHMRERLRRVVNRHQEMEDHAMKNFVLAAFAALSLTTAIASVASARNTVAGDTRATQMQQTGAYGAGG